MAFEENLDTILQVNKAARGGLGEDSFYCARSANSAIVSVCDGCGGLGARKYSDMSGHTGAYMASRLVSGALRDWFHDNCNNRWADAQQLAESINTYIRRAFAVCDPYTSEKMVIRGSLMRKLPTTMALAYAEPEGKGTAVHLIWAGDSRVYLLDSAGLAQLTTDDTSVIDAFENLTSDSPMTNVIAADGNYRLNTSSIRLNGPSLIFACTDGCFGYMHSPMDFEYVLLESIVDSKDPEELRSKLVKRFDEFAGDDYAMALMSLSFGTFEATRRAFSQRLQYIKKNYIIDYEQDDHYDRLKGLWQEYKINYERKLTGKSNNDRSNQ